MSENSNNNPNNVNHNLENDNNLSPELSSESASGLISELALENNIKLQPIAPNELSPILPEYPVNQENLDNETSISEIANNWSQEALQNHLNQDIAINDLLENNALDDWELAILNMPNLDTKPHHEDYEDYLDDSSDSLNTSFAKQDTVTMAMIYGKLLDLESEIFSLKKEINSLKNLSKPHENKIEPKKTKKPDFTEVFNPLKYLRENGQDNLKNQLDKMTNDELKEIIRSYNIKKAKEMKGIERSQMVSDIIQYAERELNRGGVFLQDR
jgi:hypothetical protein